MTGIRAVAGLRRESKEVRDGPSVVRVEGREGPKEFMGEKVSNSPKRIAIKSCRPTAVEGSLMFGYSGSGFWMPYYDKSENFGRNF